jgi:preprotein translocase subunit SecE
MNGMISYFRESYEELRKVNWPTRDEVIQGTQTVLIFVIGFTILLWMLDLVFGLFVRTVL